MRVDEARDTRDAGLRTGNGPGGERVLVVPLGISPAVLTETVWAMAVDKSNGAPDRVVVLTTVPGARSLRARLFDEGGWEALLDALRSGGHITPGRRIRFGPSADSVRLIPSPDGSRDLADIHTAAECESMAGFFAETLRAFTENPDVHLTVSIAGGRKTMGALLHAAMTLLGRAEDRMAHVLVTAPWDRIPGFLFPGCAGSFEHPDTGSALDSGKAVVTLTEVPFVPLRYLFEREIRASAGSFSRLMRDLRRRAVDFEDGLTLRLDGNPDKPEVSAGGHTISLRPVHFALYLYFGDRSRAGRGPLPNLSDVTADDLHAAARVYANGREDRLGHWTHAVLERGAADWDPKEDPRRLASEIRRKLKTAGLDAARIDHLVPRRDCIEISLSPERIEIVPSTAENS